MEVLGLYKSACTQGNNSQAAGVKLGQLTLLSSLRETSEEVCMKMSPARRSALVSMPPSVRMRCQKTASSLAKGKL